MSCCTWWSKFGLTLINLLFLAAGAGMIVLGCIMIRELTHYSSYSAWQPFVMAMLPAVAVLSAGVLALILGFFGCISTCKRNKCLHGTYFTLLLLMFIALIVGVILGAVYRSKIESGLNGVMKDSMDKYQDERVAATVNMVQQDFQCCGVDNATDWLQTKWYKESGTPWKHYPESCCDQGICLYNSTVDARLYDEGCYTKVYTKFNHYFTVIAACIGGFALILVIGMVLNCVLVMQKKRDAYNVPYVDLNNEQHHRDGMRI